jgi:hypothetical protein
MLSFLKNKQIVANLKLYESQLRKSLVETDINGYFWIMMTINKLLDDDHSSIRLTNL